VGLGLTRVSPEFDRDQGHDTRPRDGGRSMNPHAGLLWGNRS
jgi:hypothetical protein